MIKTDIPIPFSQLIPVKSIERLLKSINHANTMLKRTHGDMDDNWAREYRDWLKELEDNGIRLDIK